MSTPLDTPISDSAQQILAPAQADPDAKAQAWEAYHNSPTSDALATAIGGINLPQEIKASLWEAKNAIPAARAAIAANPPAVQRPGNPIISDTSYQATPAESTPEGHAAAVAQREQAQPAITGAGEAAGDVWGAVKSMANPMTSGALGAGTAAFEHVKETIPMLKAYENARASGKGVIASVSAANAVAGQLHDAQDVLKQRVDEFKKNPTQATTRAIGDAAAMAATLWSGGETTEAPVAPAEAEAAEGVTHAFDADTQALTPVDQAVNKGVMKSGMTEEGEIGLPKPLMSNSPASALNDSFKKVLRESLNATAKDEGLKPLESISVRDLGKELGDQFYTRSKAGFKAVQDATGLDLNQLQKDISTLQDKVAEEAGEDPERTASLIEKINAKQDIADKAFADAKAKGIDVDQPQSDWKKFNAAYDLGKQVRMSTAGREGIGEGEILDSSKLGPRLHKMYDSTSPTQPGRLQQLMGVDNSNKLLTTAEQHHDMHNVLTNWVPESSTGQHALADIIRKNTIAKPSTLSTATFGKFGGPVGDVDWEGSLKDFEDLNDAEQDAKFGDESSQVRRYLNRQAAKQTVLKYVKLSGKWGIPGVVTEEVLRRSLSDSH